MKKYLLKNLIKNILKEEIINEQALSDFVLTCTGGACLCECQNIDDSTTCPSPCGSTCSDFCIEPGVAPVTPDKSFAGMRNKKSMRRR